MSRLAPRVVIVRRPSEFELLVAAHGTREQARFALATQPGELARLDAQHVALERALTTVRSELPRNWRVATLLRAELDRFVFEENDAIVAVGQDGLVANVAKYLDGQAVIGVNPDASSYEGVLVRHAPSGIVNLIDACFHGTARLEERTMAQARLDDGQLLLALNEIFIGHSSHQSARYRLATAAGDEHHSSSGVIVSTGTGASGWARSINRERRESLSLPRPTEARLAYFVREAFPGSGFVATTTAGHITRDQHLDLVSEMNAGGAIFGDGIEADHLAFPFGSRVELRVAPRALKLAA